eukprot:jgi/Botrbrau1/18694/Bobra.0386s0021.1
MGSNGDLPSYRLAEIAAHDTPEDCWLIIDGGVYDVSSFIPLHPGGDIIAVRAGGDCSDLFASYHPLSTRNILHKFQIGKLDGADPAVERLVKYDNDWEEGKFYHVLKDRVEKYMRENKIDPRFSIAMYVKSLTIFGAIGLCWWHAFFGGHSLALALLAAAGLGVGMAEVGVSIMHDANHGAYSRNRWVTRLMAASLDVVGASSFMWRQTHVVGHHLTTNLEKVDPDICISPNFIRRVTLLQPLHPLHFYQHLYLGFLYGVLALKTTFMDDFSGLASGRTGTVDIARLTPGERAVFWAGKAIFALWFLLLPTAFSGLPWARLLLLWLCAEAMAGWVLAFMFQVAHITPDVEYLASEAGSGKVNRGWAAAQVATTADFSHGSWFWTHFSGGLNYQVIHHLFPGICHTHYPRIAPIVLKTCKEFNVPYVVYPSFWAAVSAHFRHLKQMGYSSWAHVPSLATVG